MTIVDFHNHYYPPDYIDALRGGDCSVTVTTDADGNPVLHSPGDANTAVPGHRDIAYRQQVLDEHGISAQVITFTSPGTHVEEPARAVRLACQVNDALGRIRQERGDRFLPLATLPLNDPHASVAEFERATDQLGLYGVMVFSNVNGVALWDQRYWDLYEAASERGAVFFIHPTHPVGVEAMTEFWLMPLIGFPFDTSLAAAGLVFSGVAERYPGIRWVLGHLGGAIPYLAERLDRGWQAFESCRANLSRAPSEYLKDFYYDTVNFDPRALQLALDFAGPEHVMAGSDYPHQIGSLTGMLESIEALGLSDEDRSRVLGQNALRLLGAA